MNPIYDETYMGGYRTHFNTILERGVRELNTTVEVTPVVFNDVKRNKKDENGGCCKRYENIRRIERNYIRII
jgi:hypothetical protein